MLRLHLYIDLRIVIPARFSQQKDDKSFKYGQTLKYGWHDPSSVMNAVKKLRENIESMIHLKKPMLVFLKISANIAFF